MEHCAEPVGMAIAMYWELQTARNARMCALF